MNEIRIVIMALLAMSFTSCSKGGASGQEGFAKKETFIESVFKHVKKRSPASYA